jgi:hypothetical protein
VRLARRCRVLARRELRRAPLPLADLLGELVRAPAVLLALPGHAPPLLSLGSHPLEPHAQPLHAQRAGALLVRVLRALLREERLELAAHLRGRIEARVARGRAALLGKSREAGGAVRLRRPRARRRRLRGGPRALGRRRRQRGRAARRARRRGGALVLLVARAERGEEDVVVPLEKVRLDVERVLVRPAALLAGERLDKTQRHAHIAPLAGANRHVRRLHLESVSILRADAQRHRGVQFVRDGHGLRVRLVLAHILKVQALRHDGDWLHPACSRQRRR